jgi:hypothetical protein
MTRKQYQRRLTELTIAIWKDGRLRGNMPDKGLGAAVRRVRDNAKNVPAKFGSYDNAWNNPTMQDVRKMFGVR